MMCNWTHLLKAHFCTLLLCAAIMGRPAHADPMVDFIIEQFQKECDAAQANFRGIDDDPDAPLRGVLKLSEDAIYDIALTPDGVTGTVLYNEFHCTNAGHGWCGSGGCGFHIIVGGVAFFRQGGFRPSSLTTEDTTIVLISIDGGGCVTSDGSRGAAVDPCYVVATWDAAAQTFRSNDGELALSPLNP
jgi:hypothetical protein